MKVMSVELATLAQELGIKYFLVSFSDLLGTVRAKLVPAAAIGEMSNSGAGFAGFATWLDMTPADPDVFAIPDAASLMQLPWKKEVAWVAADETPIAALRKLLRRRVSGAPVLDAEGKLVGVVSEYDLLQWQDRLMQGVANDPGADPAEYASRLGSGSVREIMAHPVVTVDESAPLSAALHRFLERRIRRLPVVRTRSNPRSVDATRPRRGAQPAPAPTRKRAARRFR